MIDATWAAESLGSIESCFFRSSMLESMSTFVWPLSGDGSVFLLGFLLIRRDIGHDVFVIGDPRLLLLRIMTCSEAVKTVDCNTAVPLAERMLGKFACRKC